MDEPSLKSLSRLSELEKTQDGFATLGNAVNSLAGLYQEIKRKDDLGQKILMGKRLNISERNEIFSLITHKEPPVSKKRGRPPRTDKDFNLAIDYLYKKEGVKRIDKLRNELAKKHGLPLTDDVVRENTFYIAVDRGIKELKSLTVWWLDNYDNGGFSDRPDEEVKTLAASFKETLRRIESYKRHTERLQKNKPK